MNAGNTTTSLADFGRLRRFDGDDEPIFSLNADEAAAFVFARTGAHRGDLEGVLAASGIELVAGHPTYRDFACGVTGRVLVTGVQQKPNFTVRRIFVCGDMSARAQRHVAARYFGHMLACGHVFEGIGDFAHGTRYEPRFSQLLAGVALADVETEFAAFERLHDLDHRRCDPAKDTCWPAMRRQTPAQDLASTRRLVERLREECPSDHKTVGRIIRDAASRHGSAAVNVVFGRDIVAETMTGAAA